MNQGTDNDVKLASETGRYVRIEAVAARMARGKDHLPSGLRCAESAPTMPEGGVE